MKISEIGEMDILEHKHWRAWRTAPDDLEGHAEPDSEIADLDYGWYISYAKYTLNDGTELHGMVTDLYQRSHHKVFLNGKQFSLSDTELAQADEISKMEVALSKSANKIYPTTYVCSLPHWGRTVTGKINAA